MHASVRFLSLISMFIVICLQNKFINSTRRKQTENLVVPATTTPTAEEFVDEIYLNEYNVHYEDATKTEIDYSKLTLYSYDENGDIIYTGRVDVPNDLSLMQCDKEEKFTVMVHGWRESCRQEIYHELAKKYKEHRGGCVTCFDYSPYSGQRNYFRLVRNFKSLKNALVKALKIIADQGFSSENSHAFGFSYGGRLCLKALSSLQGKYSTLDVCDMAGPGFDLPGRHLRGCNYRDAADNVQCMYTNIGNRGTRCSTGCHQNWRLGFCGLRQPAAEASRTESHVLCPQFYLSSFEHKFLAEPRPIECSATASAVFPENYQMGYMEDRKNVYGELFARTCRDPPFNAPCGDSKVYSAPNDLDIHNELTEEERWYGKISEVVNETAINKGI